MALCFELLIIGVSATICNAFNTDLEFLPNAGLKLGQFHNDTHQREISTIPQLLCHRSCGGQGLWEWLIRHVCGEISPYTLTSIVVFSYLQDGWTDLLPHHAEYEMRDKLSLECLLT